MAREPGRACTTRCQLFNDEITKKENDIRMKWFVKNRHRLLENLQDDKFVDRIQKTREKHEEERLERRKEEAKILKEDKPLPEWRLPKLDGSINLNVMKPVDPSVRAILYETGEGSYINAYKYLNQRHKAKPENRFYYPDCTSWLHGWRLTDYPPVPATRVGKSSIIRETFYRRNGSSLKREYESSPTYQTTNPKNFNDILSY